jgi:DNA-binding CsgD family transcriptional regulator
VWLRTRRDRVARSAVEMWTRRYQLTPLEATILGDAIHGFDRSEIAQGRDLSVETVKTHISHLLRKTGDDGLGEAARRLLYELVFECDELFQKG